jgi:hypothetical protein
VFEREREREKERERDSDTESLTQEHSVHKRDLLTLQKRPTNTTKEPYLDLADSVKVGGAVKRISSLQEQLDQIVCSIATH